MWFWYDKRIWIILVNYKRANILEGDSLRRLASYQTWQLDDSFIWCWKECVSTLSNEGHHSICYWECNMSSLSWKMNSSHWSKISLYAIGRAHHQVSNFAWILMIICMDNWILYILCCISACGNYKTYYMVILHPLLTEVFVRYSTWMSNLREVHMYDWLYL